MRYCSRCKSAFRTEQVRCPHDGAEILELDEDPLVGHQLGGRYTIVSRLARGGMGIIYRGEHVEMGKHFAVKVLYGDVASDEANVERFKLEARTASHLDHPNIISVTDFDRSEEGLLFLVMELLKGKDLYRRVQQTGPYRTEKAVFVLRQMCRALAHAHASKLIHRDLKCENVFLAKREETQDFVKILDFGLARLRDVSLQADRRSEETGMVFGTPEYMPPEQAQGKEADARSDIYSMGIIAYRLLTGVLPFTGPHAMDICTQQILDPPRPMKEVRPDIEVPEELERVVRTLLEKRPADRYQRAEDVLSALDPFPPHSRYGIPVGTGDMSAEAILEMADLLRADRRRARPEQGVLPGERDKGDLPTAPPIPASAVPTYTAIPSIALDRLLEEKRTFTRPTAPPITTDLEPGEPQKRSGWGWVGGAIALLALVGAAAWGLSWFVGDARDRDGLIGAADVDTGSAAGHASGAADPADTVDDGEPGTATGGGDDSTGTPAAVADGEADAGVAATDDGDAGATGDGDAEDGGAADAVGGGAGDGGVETAEGGDTGKGKRRPGVGSRGSKASYKAATKGLKHALTAGGLTRGDLNYDPELASIVRAATTAAKSRNYTAAEHSLDKLNRAIEGFDFNRKFLANKLDAVGRALDRAEKKKGEAAVAPLRNRWHRLASDMPRAISDPRARKHMSDELAKILKEL